MENPEKINVVFLDIDGVMRTTLSMMFEPEDTVDDMFFDPTAVLVLKNCVKMLDLKVVLASSWAVGMTRERLTELESHLGFEFYGVVYDDMISSRPKAIDAYMSNRPQIDKWCIIDDEVKWYADTRHQDKFIFIDEHVGFTYQTVIDLFNKFDVPIQKFMSLKRAMSNESQ